MRYKGTFKDINDKQYTVYIITNNDYTQEEEITLSSSPFSISYEGGDSTLYKPIKYSDATCSIVTNKIYYDIYSAENQNTKIELFDEDTKMTVWCGYVTPNVYSQPYSPVDDILEIECVDGLSTLKNIKYTTINDECEIVSFYQLFQHCLTQTNTIGRLHITNAIQKKLESSFTFLDELFINEKNFFDEDNEAMMVSEVLEEILKYLNLTLYARGGDAYIIDYDAIVSDDFVDTYDCFILNNGTLLSTFDVETKQITGAEFRSSDATINVENCYNKVTVVADKYSIEESEIDLFGGDTLENISCENRDDFIIDNAYCGSDDEYHNDKENKYLYYRLLRQKGVNNKYYKKIDGEWVQTDEYPTDYLSIKNYAGVTLYQWAVSDEPKYKAQYTKCQPQGEIKFENVILLHTQGMVQSSIFGTSKVEGFSIQPFNNGIVTNNHTYININCSSVWRTIKRYYTCDKYDDDEWCPNRTLPYILYIIRNKNTGDFVSWYGNGPETQKRAKWKKAEEFEPIDWNYRKLEFVVDFSDWKKAPRADVEYDNMLDKDLSLLSNVDYTMNFGDIGGQVIKMPPATDLSQVEIVFYLPALPDYNAFFEDDHNCPPLQTVMIKDFDVKLVYPSEKNKQKLTEDDEVEENTKYENIINDNWVGELSEISFKVHTNDTESCDYSSVYETTEDGEMQCANTLKNLALNQELKQEEMLIYRIVKQYEKPRISLELTLTNNYNMNDKVVYPSQEKDKKFIIDTMTIDVANNTSSLKIIEKA